MGVGNISIVNTEYFRSQKGDGSEPTKIDKTISNLALPTSLHAMPMQPMYYKGYIGNVSENRLCFKRVVWQKKSDVPFDLEDYYFLDSEYLKQFTKQENIYPVDAIFCASAHIDGEHCFNKTYITERIGGSFVPVTKINFDGTATCGYCMTAIVTFCVDDSYFWYLGPEISVYLRPDGTYGFSNFVEKYYNTAQLVHDLKKSMFPFEFGDRDSIKIDNIFNHLVIADFQVYDRKNKKMGFSIRNNNDYTYKQNGKLKSFWHRPHEMSNNKLRKSYLLNKYRKLFRVKFYTKRSPWIYFYLVCLLGKEVDYSKPARYKAVCIDKKS